MANPNPRTDQLEGTQFKKGQSGNPGGMPKETAELIRTNAERASRLREKLLAQIEEAVENDAVMELGGDLLRLLKDSEDRGYGAPKQSVDGNVDTTVTFKTVYEAKE